MTFFKEEVEFLTTYLRNFDFLVLIPFIRHLLSLNQNFLSWVQKLHVLVDKVDQLYVFQRTPNWFFPRIEGNFPQWYKYLLRMFPFLMTLNFWIMFALIEVQSLLWMRKGWTERYDVILIIFNQLDYRLYLMRYSKASLLSYPYKS